MKDSIIRLIVNFVCIAYCSCMMAQSSQDVDMVREWIKDNKLEEIKEAYLERCLNGTEDVSLMMGVFYACLHSHDYENATLLEREIKNSDVSLQMSQIFFEYYFWKFAGEYGILLDDREADLYLEMQKQRSLSSRGMMSNLARMAEMFSGYGEYGIASKYYEGMDAYKSDVSPVLYTRHREELAWVYFNLHKYQLAYRLFKECADKYKECFGQYNQMYLRSLNNIGFSMTYLNKDPIETYLEVKILYDSLQMDRTYEYAIVLDNISSCYKGAENYEKALEFALKANDIFQDYSPEEDYAINLNDISCYYGFLGNKEKELEYLLKALEINPSNNTILSNLALYYRGIGDNDSAEKYYSMISETSRNTVFADDIANFYASIGNEEMFLEYKLKDLDFMRRLARQNFSEMTEEEKEGYVGVMQDMNTDYMFDVASKTNDKRFTRLCFDYLLSSKSLMLSFNNSIKDMVSRSENAMLKTLYFNMNMAHSKAQKDVSCQAYADSLEYQFLSLLKQEGDYTDFMNIQTSDIVKCLDKGDLVVEFSEVKKTEGAVLYAVVLNNDGKPKVLKLCQSEDLNDTNVYELIWLPLAANRQSIKNIYFSPAGILHTMGIEYAKDEKGKLACENWNIYRLSSTRELIKRGQHGHRRDNAVLYGGLVYSESDADLLGTTRSHIRGSVQTTPVLPGSKKEVEEIEQLLKDKSYDVVLKEGLEGTEGSLKSLSGESIGILHLSTHGFYNPETKEHMTSLSRTGLLMSSANDYEAGIMEADDEEDGIITAEEMSRLDFHNLNLVVLSACETGLGDVKSDGVFGLQRGFKKAGAQTLLMSLWKVDDTATQLLMTSFYRYLTKGESKMNSLQKAIKDLRKYDGGKFDSPKYWASFILLDAID